ncbi:MAG: hypothetical protein ABR508_06500 [Candidatus Baltobacteraceae bacterium]
MDPHLYIGLAVLALAAAGVISYAARPAAGPLGRMYRLLNRRPLVKPFDPLAREIYERQEDGGDDAESASKHGPSAS